MPRPLEEAVVVVTGASSGIGREVALRLARRGSSLALCARGQGPLAAVAAECEAAGAEVLQRTTDVGDEAAVERLAAATEERFGRIDVWVNNAGVIAYGRFEEIPSEVFRRVIETDLMGQVHGARAALRRFRAQGSGVLINMSSVWGRVSSPQVAPYVVSKNAVRALSECLHSELADEPDINVATIVPQAVARRSSSTAPTTPATCCGRSRRSCRRRRSRAGSRPAPNRRSARSITAAPVAASRSSTRRRPASTAASPTRPSSVARSGTNRWCQRPATCSRAAAPTLWTEHGGGATAPRCGAPS